MKYTNDELHKIARKLRDCGNDLSRRFGYECMMDDTIILLCNSLGVSCSSCSSCNKPYKCFSVLADIIDDVAEPEGHKIYV